MHIKYIRNITLGIFAAVIYFISPYNVFATTCVSGSACTGGSGTWVAPAGVSSISIEVWGGGGAGAGQTLNNNRGQSGGGGGAYSKKTSMSVTPGSSYGVTIGAGGVASTGAGGTGGDTWFCNATTNCTSILGTAVQVGAKGGTGGSGQAAHGTGGASTSGVGDVKFSGGNGGDGGIINGSGGGGGAGGSTENGGVGGNGSAGPIAGAAGIGGVVGGGDGGVGLATGATGNIGATPGGGGGGTYINNNTNRSGGAGAVGQIILTYTVDTTPPTVSNVSSTLADGSYTVGQVVPITVTFSEIVNVTGTPQLTLETGTTDRTINYTSGTGTTVLTFSYTVQSGDTTSDLDYLSTTALTLNGGTIRDAALNNATLTLPTVGGANSIAGQKAIVIDALSPILATVTPITSPTNDNTPDFTFSSTEAGAITYGGGCSSATSAAIVGSNTITLDGLADGTYASCTIVVTDATGNASATLTIPSFVVNTAPPATKFVLSSAASATVGGTVVVTIQAQDASSVLVNTYQNDVTLVVSGAASGAGLVNIVNGAGSVNITDTTAETVHLSLSDTEVTGLDVSSTQDIVFNPGTIDHVTIAAVTSPQIAGTPFALSMTAKDVYGNTATSFTGSVNFSTTAGSISPTVSAAFVAGVRTENVSVTQSGNNHTITATNSGGSEAGQTNTFTVQAGAVATFLLDDPGNMTANTRLGYTVTRKDTFGNLVTSGATTVYLYSSDAGTTDVFYDAATNGNIVTSMSIPDGASTASFWYYDETAGTWVITVSDHATAPDGATGVADAEDSVTVGPEIIIATKFIIVDPTDATVGDTAIITIHAVNDANNIDTNYSQGVTLHTSGSATIGGLVNIVNGAGSVNITDTTAETVHLSLSDTEVTGLDVSSTQDIVFNPGTIDHVTIAAVTSPQIAGTPFALSMTAKDVYGNTATSFTGSVNFSTTAGSISPTVSAAFVAGVRTENVSVTQSGNNHTITATNSGGSEAGQTNTFTVQAGAVATFLLDDPGNMTANTRLGYTVTRKDTFGNLVTSGATTVYLYSSDAGTTDVFYDAATNGNIVTSISIPDGASTASFWYYDETAGTWVITVSDHATAPDGATGVADAEDDLAVSVAPIVATRLIIIDPTNVQINTAATVTVKAVDANDNVQSNYAGTVTLAASGSATGDGVVTIVNGVGSLDITDAVAETVHLSLIDTASTSLDVSSTQDIVFSENVPPVIAPSGPGGGGGSMAAPTAIAFTGSTFPIADVTLFTLANGQIPLREGTANQGGRFSINYSGLLPGFSLYGLYLRDRDGNTTPVRIFSVDVTKPNLLIQNLLLPPTISVLRDTISQSDFLTMSGYANSGSTVTFTIDDTAITPTATAGTDGQYKLLYNVSALPLGSHTVRARQRTSDGRVSDFSISKSFTISSLFITGTDLNADGKTDIKDLSIFMSMWLQTNNVVGLKKLDVNRDGKVDLQDFSMFVQALNNQ